MRVVPTPRRIRIAALSIAGWSFLALLYCTSDYLQMRVAFGQPVSWWQMLPRHLLVYAVWAVLTPAVVALARRLVVEPPHRARNAAAHLLLAPVAALAHSAAYIFLAMRVLSAPPGQTFGGLVMRQLGASGLLAMTMYLTIVFVYHTQRYHRALREREVAQSRLEAQLAHARLTALRAQLNPHFLFNTLHSVSALMARDVAAARQMLARLSDLLRLALEGGPEQECTLGEEMDFVGHYLSIQEIRFRDRLQVARDVDADTLRARVPRLLLQPLVENAIEHALEPGEGATRVHIAAVRVNGTLHLTVRDDGPGPDGPAPRERIGLGNTRARLAALYGAAASLQVGADPAGGTAVRVTLPFRLENG